MMLSPSARERPVALRSGYLQSCWGRRLGVHGSFPSVPAGTAVETAARLAALQRQAEERFNSLASAWRLATGHLSSVTAIVAHPDYQAIIRGGYAMLPPILRCLEQGPAIWWPALEAITGENPVPPDDVGRAKKVASHWLSWAKANDIVW